MRVLPPRTARLLYRSRARRRRTTRRQARLHAEDVRYVLVSERSKKKAAADGRLLCHGFTSRALGAAAASSSAARLELARASESSCPVPASVPSSIRKNRRRRSRRRSSGSVGVEKMLSYTHACRRSRVY